MKEYFRRRLSPLHRLSLPPLQPSSHNANIQHIQTKIPIVINNNKHEILKLAKTKYFSHKIKQIISHFVREVKSVVKI